MRQRGRRACLADPSTALLPPVEPLTRTSLRKLIGLCAIPLRAMMAGRAYVVRRGLAKGLRRRGGIAFIPEFIVSLSAEETYLRSMQLDSQVIYDIGGYEGTFALFFARAVGVNGSVYVFEPNPHNVLCIENNIAINGLDHVTVFPVGLSDHTGLGTLHYDPKITGRGVIRAEEGPPDAQRSTQVQLWKLDDFIDSQNIPRPDFVKIDVEGHEIHVLQGMPRLLREKTPRLWIETHAEYIQDEDKRETYKAALKNILSEYQYKATHIETMTHLDLNAPMSWQDGHWYCQPKRGQRGDT